MAEIVGLAASAATLFEVCKPLLRLSKALYRASSASGAHGKEICATALSIQTSATVIDYFIRAMTRHLETMESYPGAGFQLAQYIEQKGILENFRYCAKYVEEQVKEMLASLRKDRRQFVKDVKWHLWQRDRIWAISPLVESLKNSIGALIPLVGLQVNAVRAEAHQDGSPALALLKEEQYVQTHTI
jgi:hypothetical protein